MMRAAKILCVMVLFYFAVLLIVLGVASLVGAQDRPVVPAPRPAASGLPLAPVAPGQVILIQADDRGAITIRVVPASDVAAMSQR